MKHTGDYFRALVSGRARGPWPGIQRIGLRAASLPYGWAVGLRNRLYDCGWKRSYEAGVPVVSVGNLTLGGTGKTPCVEYVARFYRERGLKPGILSRGYGSQGGRNDEALVLAENLPDVPHLQGADRVALAKQAVALGCKVLVLDDGFQHRRLARDLDLVLIDATDPWGHGRLFPGGLLREPPERLAKAGMIVLTRCDQVGADDKARIRKKIARYAPNVAVAETVHQPVNWGNNSGQTASLDELRRQPAVAFCGIGNPDAFRQTLLDLEMELIDFRTYPDHHAYTPADLAELADWATRHKEAGTVLTTQKDLVKVRQERLADKPLWALRIGLAFDSGQEVLDRKLKNIL